MTHLSDTDQTPYSALEPQNATVSDEAAQAAEAQFTSYFINNYPKDCIIYNPAWHAPKIFSAAKAAMTENIPHLVPCVTKPVDVAAVRRQALEEAKAIAFDTSENGQYMGNGDCSGHSIYQQGATEVYDALCDLISDISPAEPVDPWQDIATAQKGGAE